MGSISPLHEGPNGLAPGGYRSTVPPTGPSPESARPGRPESAPGLRRGVLRPATGADAVRSAVGESVGHDSSLPTEVEGPELDYPS